MEGKARGGCPSSGKYLKSQIRLGIDLLEIDIGHYRAGSGWPGSGLA